MFLLFDPGLSVVSVTLTVVVGETMGYNYDGQIMYVFVAPVK